VSKPLWSIERIADITSVLREPTREQCQIVATRICDEYEAKIAELEAERDELRQWLEKYRRGNEQLDERVIDLEQRLAEMSEWQPVKDGIYGKHDTVTISDSGQMMYVESAYGNGQRTSSMIPLPEQIRLCRRTVAGEASIDEK
jgi:hypothetical protein